MHVLSVSSQELQHLIEAALDVAPRAQRLLLKGSESFAVMSRTIVLAGARRHDGLSRILHGAYTSMVFSYEWIDLKDPDTSGLKSLGASQP